jgi:hypothetical protein
MARQIPRPKVIKAIANGLMSGEPLWRSSKPMTISSAKAPLIVVFEIPNSISFPRLGALQPVVFVWDEMDCTP